MKILFYDTQSYDRESFDRTKEQFPEIEVEYLKTGLAARTASLAKGYDAVCAFVNSDVGTKTVEALHEAGVKLILMRCAGFNNVDLKTAAKYGIDTIPSLMLFKNGTHGEKLVGPPSQRAVEDWVNRQL